MFVRLVGFLHATCRLRRLETRYTHTHVAYIQRTPVPACSKVNIWPSKIEHISLEVDQTYIVTLTFYPKWRDSTIAPECTCADDGILICPTGGWMTGWLSAQLVT